MRYWTIQTRDVVEQIHENGIFEPDFKKSRYIKIRPSLSELYDSFLSAFNRANNVSLAGLVFAFTYYEGTKYYEIKNIEGFTEVIRAKRNVIEGLWRNFDPQEHVVLEVEYPENFNPLYIDINDFQFLMPPVVFPYPYTPQFLETLQQNIDGGKWTDSPFPSQLLQVHLPYIKEENLIAVHDFFSL